MSCCGQKRRAWRNAFAGSELAPPVPATGEIQSPDLRNPVTLYHLADHSLVVRGAVTNITYLFGGKDSSLDVDGRDAPELLATGHFATVRSQ